MKEYKNKGWLENKYLFEKLGIYQIAEICDCHPRTIHQNLIKHNIPRRKVGVEHWTDEQKEYKANWNKSHPEIYDKNKGRKASEETKKKMSDTRCGSNNSNWRGGEIYELRKWRKAVLNRDGWICQYQNCGKSTTIAHHIKPVKSFPDLKLIVSNGMAICNAHHNTIHHRNQKYKQNGI
jgi:hypothetical protein